MTRKNDSRQTVGKIMAAAAKLFMEKGYEQTTITDILKVLGMSKGAIFHHFKSKEEIMEGVVKGVIESIVERVNTVVDNPSLSAAEKMRRAISLMNISEDSEELIHELHKPANAQMHQRSITETIYAVAPILEKVVRQGISEGIYETPYPLETIEFLLAANQFIFDKGIFSWTGEELQTRALAFVRVTERSLGAAEGSFAFLLN